jgi:hypothetical protein
MATKQWHREEPREVRPFFSTIDAEQSIRQTTIQLFSSSEPLSDTSFELDEIDFKKLAPIVHPIVSPTSTWMPAGLLASDLELVLIARHGFLKRSEILTSCLLADEVPSSWAISEATLSRLGGGRNLELTVAVCLRNDRTPTPGSPFVPGHWLAKKTFLLRSRTMPTLFDLRVRSDAEWTAAGYPPKTFYAVEYLGGIDTDLDEGASVATVYVHTDAHQKMVSGASGEFLQPVLGAEIISAILLESFKDWRQLESVDTASPLATLLKQLGKENPLTLQSLKTLVQRPPLLKATLQDRLSVLSALR